MNQTDRIQAFVTLGNRLRTLPADQFNIIAQKAHHENGWFSRESVALAFKGISVQLEESRLANWISGYPVPASARQIGVAMAGNIPLVGFHDFCVTLLSGHRLRYKPSSRDSVLLDYLQQQLIDIEPQFADYITAVDQLKGVDAIIATGSDNTSRYFEYYFRNIPHIIRKNRVSCAVIEGDEPASELALLGRDVFDYYGLGCRNVSTIYVPREFDMKSLLDAFESFKDVMDNTKYANNYTYQRSLALLNEEKFLDTGFLLVKESKALVSPVACIHYAYYDDQESLKRELQANEQKIQVVVSAKGWYGGSIPFGTAQTPRIDDFADQIDTMKFLTALT